jgi:hypothetical protein
MGVLGGAKWLTVAVKDGREDSLLDRDFGGN